MAGAGGEGPRGMLTLYRRHSQDCQHYGKPRNAPRTRGCDCPIWVQGSLGGEYIRESLNLTSWEAASERVRSWEASGEIGVTKSQAPNVSEAIAKFIADAQARNLKPESIKKIRDVTERRLQRYCTTNGYTRLRQLDVDAVREFRNELANDYSPNSARKRLEYVRSFFRFCHQSGWIPTNPAVVVRPPKADDSGVETFEPEEIEAMLKVADNFRTKGKFGAGNRKRIRAMILLLRFSGIRISDGAVLAREKLNGDKLSLRTIKTGKDVWCPLPPEAVKALGESVSDNAAYFFWNGRCKETSAVKIWERTLQRVFELAAIPEHKAFPHNFRHSFATDLLARGIPIEDVAALLGNSVKIVEKHYAHLVRSRQLRLEERIRTLWT